MTDFEIMRQALRQADIARRRQEVPIGAVVVLDGKIIATGFNSVIASSDPTAHAEIVAIRNACGLLGNYRLPEAELFVTIEPCAMCAGAIIHARIRRLVYGASEYRTGAAGSVFSILQGGLLNHKTEISGGILEDECRRIMQDFFRERREAQKAAKKHMEAGDEDE